MSNPRHTAEEYRAICILLVIALAIMAYWWYTSEKSMAKEIDFLQQQRDEYEERISELEKDVKYWQEEAGA